MPSLNSRLRVKGMVKESRGSFATIEDYVCPLWNPTRAGRSIDRSLRMGVPAVPLTDLRKHKVHEKCNEDCNDEVEEFFFGDHKYLRSQCMQLID